jgi:hypothetical protein
MPTARSSLSFALEKVSTPQNVIFMSDVASGEAPTTKKVGGELLRGAKKDLAERHRA